MLKASALYIAIIIALVIGILCAALVATAYFYKIQYFVTFKKQQLQNNVSSGVNLLLVSDDNDYFDEKKADLFVDNNDSLSIKRVFWGAYDIGVVRAFIKQDTLSCVFSIASIPDSAMWAALYLSNEDRPLTVSGETLIKGDAYLPSAGIKKGYINNKFYTGDERLIIGNKSISQRKLPGLDNKRLTKLNSYLQPVYGNDKQLLNDSITNSFLNETLNFDLRKNAEQLKYLNLSGNIILHADTTITLDSTVSLNNVLVFAPVIIVGDAFRGTCQLFASDTIKIGKNCVFSYPSCLGVIKMNKSSNHEAAAQLYIGEKSIIHGLVASYQEDDINSFPVITLAKDVRIFGQVYSHGVLRYEDKFEVNGSLYTRRFMYTTEFDAKENVLFNCKINFKGLSSYYLNSALSPSASSKKKILQWLK